MARVRGSRPAKRLMQTYSKNNPTPIINCKKGKIMQEMQDKTLVEIVKAYKGAFIYAPGGTVNIGCVMFDGPSNAKKAVPKKAGSAEAEKPKAVRRRKATTKVDEKAEPPKGDSASPPPVDTNDGDDNEGDGSAPDPAAATSWGSRGAGPADSATPTSPFSRPRRREPNNGA